MNSLNTQELLQQMSETPPTELNTQILLQILKNITDLASKIDVSFERIKDVESRMIKIESRFSELEKNNKQSVEDNTAASIGESQKTTETLEVLRNENNYLHQWRIDCDIFLSGFPFKPDVSEISNRLCEIYSFSSHEISYEYSFTYTNPKTKAHHHYVVIGLNRREIKNKIFTEKSVKGPLFLSDFIGAQAGNSDPQILISNRLTKLNLRLQKELSNLKSKSLLYKILYKNCSLYAIPKQNDTPIPIKSFNDIEVYTNSFQRLNSTPNQGPTTSTNHNNQSPQLQGIKFQQRNQQRITTYYKRS